MGTSCPPVRHIHEPSPRILRKHRQFFDGIQVELGIRCVDDWYTVAKEDLYRLGAGSILRNYYENSHVKALQFIYPEVEWLPWRFASSRSEYWNSLDNQKKFLEWLAKKLELTDFNDWHSVSRQDLITYGGEELLYMYHNSVIKALQTVYPDFAWQPRKFAHVPRLFWMQNTNHKEYFDWLGQQLRVEQLEDWYRVSFNDVVELGAMSLLRYYDNSLCTALQCVYSEVQWQPWRFVNVPQGYWDKLEHHKHFFDWLRKEMKVDNLDDWYEVRRGDVVANGGTDLLKKYNNVVIKALKTVYPDQNWRHWTFAARFEFFKWVERQMDIVDLLEWYGVSTTQVVDFGGEEILNNFGGSLAAALTDVYPQIVWQPWRFAQLPDNFWDSMDHQRQFFNWVGEQLHVKVMDDWYNINKSDIDAHGGASLLTNYYHNSVWKALEKIYPFVSWQPWRFPQHSISSLLWQNLQSQKQFVEWFAQERGIQDANDWYNVSPHEVVAAGGGGFMKHYDNSMYKLLTVIYPEVEWQVWKFDHMNTRYDKERMDALAIELGITSEEDWYKVTVSNVIELGYGPLLKRYEGLLYKALQEVHPEVKWQVWRFSQITSWYWHDPVNHKPFIDWLGSKLSIKDYDDWYKVDNSTIVDYGGTTLLRYYDQSLYKVLQTVYPFHTWRPWKFPQLPTSTWNDYALHEQFFMWMSQHLGIECPSAWFRVSKKHIYEQGGRHLLNTYYYENPLKALQSLFPEIDWQPWKRGGHHKEYFDWLSVQLDVKNFEDWYTVNVIDVENNEGGRILNHYNNSLITALQSVFPNQPWQPWRFHAVPSAFWHDFDHHKQFFSWMAQRFRLQSSEDWYKVSKSAVVKIGGGELLQNYYSNSILSALQTVQPTVQWRKTIFKCIEKDLFIESPQDWYGVAAHHVATHPLGQELLAINGGSLVNLLKAQYPEIRWKAQEWPLHALSKSHQYITRTIKQWLSDKFEIESNSNLSLVKYAATNRDMQVDIWFPNFNVAVEYQGLQHYQDSKLIHGLEGVELQYEKDEEKRRSCVDAAIQLIKVPYWWNCNVHGLAALLKQYLPVDYQPSNRDGIFALIPTMPTFPLIYSGPRRFAFLGIPFFEPAKSNNWNASIDTCGWYVSTRRKNIRILTDGCGIFVTVQGKRVYPPAWLSEYLSLGIPLEFELLYEQDV